MSTFDAYARYCMGSDFVDDMIREVEAMTDDLFRAWRPEPTQRRVIMQGSVTFEPLERHDCGLVDSPNRVSLVRRSPPVWALTVFASTGTVIELIRHCPYCGDNLSPPVLPRVCDCTHGDWQHFAVDPLVGTRGVCEEVTCDCKRFEQRYAGKGGKSSERL